MIKNNVESWRTRRTGAGGLKITRARLAKRIGVCRSYISKLERGEVQPSGRVMFEIAEYFERPIEDIFTYERDSTGKGDQRRDK